MTQIEKARLRRARVSSSCLPLLLTPSLAWAQQPVAEPAAESAPVTAVDADSPTDTPDIVVTGSRIRRSEFNAPNPITAFSSADIVRSGNTNLTNFLLRTPALAGSVDDTQTAGYESIVRQPYGGAGLNELNLRNLGSNRTLVLVDGRRHVAGSFNTAAVDINAIPTDLVARVDVLTGGAGAVYGADGVSGVVNFILKRDFNGLTARSQIGISSRGDAGNRLASVTAGHNFAAGRGNVTVALEAFSSDPLANDDRAYLRQNRRQYLIQNPNDPNDDPRIPDQVLIGDLRYGGESPNGAVYLDDGDFTPDFDGNGLPYVEGTQVGGYRTGGSSTPVAGFVGDLLPKINRRSVNLLGRFDFSDAFKVSVEGKFVQVKARTFDQFTGDYPSFIAADNPFIPATIRPFVTDTGINLFRDNFEYGRHGEADRRRTIRGVLDVSGRLNDHARYDAYYTYGRTQTRITKLNARLADRYLAALDVVLDSNGRPVCRSNLVPGSIAATTFTPGPNSGCAPLNIFGSGSPSQQAIDFFQVDHVSSARVEQNVASGALSGDFGGLFRLPGGPVGFSIGAEYRREKSRFDPNDLLLNNAFYQFDEPPAILRSRGRFSVKEGFAELSAPIFAGQRFAERLSLGAAVRLSDYSTIGRTTAWQLNGLYAPIRDVTFRGSYSKTVRAPNIGELFSPAQSSQQFFTDPCDPTQISNGSQFRAANCQTVVTATGANFARFNPLGDNLFPTQFGSISGNPALAPETARTLTAGLVLRPRFVRGLTVALDYYNIRLAGAISVPAATELAGLCVDQPTIDNPFCRSVTRAAGTGFLSSFSVRPQNVSRFRTAGVDLNASYNVTTQQLGTFNFSLVGGYLDRAEFVNTPGAPPVNNVNQARNPRWQANFSPTWTLGKVSVNYNLRFVAKTLRFDRFTLAANPDVAAPDLIKYKALFQHDLQVQTQVTDQFAAYIGATNLFDQKPDRDSYDFPVSPLGRFLYVGARINLAKR